ncbi:hypothetical protein CEP54_013071 [Fusarium duplospermum]|uniref:Major facilitator superfamily (MFS) profile domain-containing protein n=1 Tax=Fusarium duplospermum TaxID=1325734 RepID=A0A428P4Z9_9HYPO|nr:hypothetical protein CEP54_013071 [Fusarium duplospermum]
MAQVYTCPESPRWLMLKSRYKDAFQSLADLRGSDIQAARDLYYIHVLLRQEDLIAEQRNGSAIVRLFSTRRNRNAAIRSFIVMFAQQFCGAGSSPTRALLASWGFGMLNFLFALPAIKAIDSFGRRKLLLWTFPLMTRFLCVTAGGFYITDGTARLAVVAVGIYLYVIAYSPGEGPVPFVYSAEAFPLASRYLGMSWAVFICWFFNSVIGLTLPSVLTAFGPQGTFFWYASWNAVLFVIIYFFLPETRSLTLEELDRVFEVPMWTHANMKLQQLVKVARW